MIHPDDPTYQRIRRNNQRLRTATWIAIGVLLLANVLKFFGL
ncbi:hypothetical protein [Cupriavidus necator]|nr:hypothetical protein [Cupriavidus necator]